MKNQKFQLNKRLAGYSATAVALAAFTANTEGQTVYSGLKNIVVKNTRDSIDIDGDGVKDFVIKNTLGGIHYAFIDNLQPSNSWLGNNSVKALSSKVYISSSSSFNGKAGLLGRYNSISHSSWGNFNGQGEKFIGVKFLIGTDIHYGWIRVNIPETDDSVTIVDWAYQKSTKVSLATGETVAPVLSSPGVINIGVDTATFHFSIDEQDYIYYGVKKSTDPAPSFDEIIADTSFIDSDNGWIYPGDHNYLLSGLTSGNSYTVYAFLYNASYDTTNITKVSFSTLDTIPPILSGVSVNNIGGYTASLNVTSDEDGTIYYAVKLAIESAPTADQIKAGIGFAAAGNIVDTAGNAKQFDIKGLACYTAYKVYVVAENLSGYTSSVSVKSFLTHLVSPPILSAASVDNIQTTSAVAHITSSEKGTAYYALKIATDPAPSDSAIKAGTGFIASGNAGVEAATPHAFSITGLSPATAYIIYLTAEDTSENLSTVDQVAFSTNSNVGINDIANNNIVIFPNPADNVLCISLPEKSEYTIFNVLGQPIQNGKLEPGISKVNISGLYQGIYFIHFNFNNGQTFVKQIMKK